MNPRDLKSFTREQVAKVVYIYTQLLSLNEKVWLLCLFQHNKDGDLVRPIKLRTWLQPWLTAFLEHFLWSIIVDHCRFQGLRYHSVQRSSPWRCFCTPRWWCRFATLWSTCMRGFSNLINSWPGCYGSFLWTAQTWNHSETAICSPSNWRHRGGEICYSWSGSWRTQRSALCRAYVAGCWLF